jgi:hypothetical protein
VPSLGGKTARLLEIRGDDAIVAVGSMKLTVPRLRRAESLYRRLLELADVEVEAGAGEGAEASFRMAGTVDFGLMVKQQLLESRSEADRLDQLVGLMSSLVPRLELRKSREEAIRGNGKGY